MILITAQKNSNYYLPPLFFALDEELELTVIRNSSEPG